MENSLRDHRDRSDISQRELAERVGVTRQTINAVEGDRYDPSVELVFKLAAFFEVPVETLFSPDVALDATVSDLD
ncbi:MULTISPECIES: helix-turn-helix transcriptional regulator [Halobacterium]|uniref:helix-turn-helix transcriptional regulator n=1 Tax=Halobacterium TaxID=2239 RepID=UPI00073FA65C|nr:helix-turn-helix transcriptional regulator [Halobacterium sp. CBA1132]MCG1004423.1 helix-turn-helix transcriptional regulator [Halobacterium noricense]